MDMIEDDKLTCAIGDGSPFVSHYSFIFRSCSKLLQWLFGKGNECASYASWKRAC